MNTKWLIVPLIGLIGCVTRAPAPALQTASPTIVREVTVDAEENAVPGTVTEDWEEPMYDVADQPAQIDPAKNYYRARHKTVIEVRPGRVQPLRYPEQ